MSIPPRSTADATTEAEAVAILSDASDLAERLADEGLALVPNGYTVRDLAELTGAPRRPKGAVRLTTVQSLRRYLERFGLTTESDANIGAAAVFADPLEGRYLAVLDYHTSEAAAHGHHRAELRLLTSEPWNVWTGSASVRKGQHEFALFVESRLDDIVDPEAARVLEAVKSIEAARNVTFKSRVDLDREDVVFHYESETKGAGDVAFPERLVLGIPVFDDGDPFRVEARLRYKMDDEAGLLLWYDLVNVEAVHRTAANDVLRQVEEIAGADHVFVGQLQ